MWEVFEYVGEGLVFIGVVGEVYAEWGETKKEALERISSLVLIVGLAISFAALIGTNKHFNGTIAALNARAAQSNKDAATAVLDAANARKETAQLQKDTQELKTDAETSKRDMVAAQLELARLNGPVVVVPVINGVARPDPMKGTKQHILLRSNTLIIFPKLPKGKSLDWTLLLTQDESGNRQFGTIPKVMPGGDSKSPFGNVLAFAPFSTCTLEMTSDEYGTIDKTFGGASCPTTPIRK
jgi:hypothetical protein